MKDPPTDRLIPTIGLLNEVLIVVVLRGHLHEGPSCARVEVVVHCSGQSGKTVNAEKKAGVRSYHYSITNSYDKGKVKAKVATALAYMVATRSIRIKVRTKKSR